MLYQLCRIARSTEGIANALEARATTSRIDPPGPPLPDEPPRDWDVTEDPWLVGTSPTAAEAAPAKPTTACADTQTACPMVKAPPTVRRMQGLFGGLEAVLEEPSMRVVDIHRAKSLPTRPTSSSSSTAPRSLPTVTLPTIFHSTAEFGSSSAASGPSFASLGPSFATSPPLETNANCA